MTDTMSEQLRIVNGKFMRGNVEVKPEIGNREQIMCLQNYERQCEADEKIAEEGIEVDVEVKNVRFDAILSFECLCGKRVQNVKEDEWSDYPQYYDSCYWEDEVITCKHCKRRYKIEGEYAMILKR